jgi:hypothetical protein
MRADEWGEEGRERGRRQERQEARGCFGCLPLKSGGGSGQPMALFVIRNNEGNNQRRQTEG